uniref:Kinesin-like protein n=1 Tax=Albugo laibachii Nc14 TaxID=890382 RepID=F0W4P7_9STRA|nr:kinesinlike protein putative [Albugo laibachii Nc14]|eukprot:CCA16082.1 kinesinlike protein putative [Albugo laibachii Nc14]
MATDVNVKVAVRCRPMNSRETQLGAKCVVSVHDNQSVRIQSPSGSENVFSSKSSGNGSLDIGTKLFTFDHAYFIDSTQEQVYNDIAKSIIDQALQGFNGTIFAYGQTGAGKTHTMMGSSEDLGIVPRMYEDLFDRIREASSAFEEASSLTSSISIQYLVTVSYLEIYNEVLKDLLSPSVKMLKIREHPDLGIYVDNLAELVVKEPNDVARLLQQGNRVRQVAATQMNEQSSRSHSCFTIKVLSKKAETANGISKETTMTAKINLVDLAGSERASKTGASGDRLKEGAAINKSLSALGNVITMLTDRSKKKQHVPYRDSKLTRLLQESLGGNSLTVMIAAISPADDNYDETLTTLQYATRAKAIKNATKRNEDINERLIRELREEIERLRQVVSRPVSASEEMNNPIRNAEIVLQMEEKIANLERVKQESWEERQRLAALFEQEREANLRNDQNILGYMETVKEEKLQVLNRIKKLQFEKTNFAKKLQGIKEQYILHKNELQKEVNEFQLRREEAQFPVEEKQDRMKVIEAKKQSVLSDREQLGKLREELVDCEHKIMQAEADLVAKGSLLNENEILRKAIQDDERVKMNAEREELLKRTLQDEGEGLRQYSEDRIKFRVLLYAAKEREHNLVKEIENQKAESDERLIRIQSEQRQWKRNVTQQLKEKFSDLRESFESDYSQLETKYLRAGLLLRTSNMAGDELDIDGFLAKLVATRQEMERWIEIKKKQLHTQKRTFTVDMQQKEKDQREAQMYRSQLEQQQESTMKQCIEKENALRANQFEVELLQSEKAKKEPVLRQLFEYNQQENEKLQALLNDATVQKQKQQQQLEELKRGLRMYQRLGLFFDHDGADKIIVRFTQIDRREPQRQFSFRICIHPHSDQFIVDDCTPPLSNLADMVAELNAHGDLPYFIRRMRRQFKQSIL